MFDDLDALAKSEGLKFTAYVDDVAFSGEKVPKGFQAKAKGIIRNHGMVPHPKKLARYADGNPLRLTGIIIDGDRILLPHKRIRSIHEEGESLKSATFRHRRIHHMRRLAGHLHSASQVNPKYAQRSKQTTDDLMALEKEVEAEKGK